MGNDVKEEMMQPTLQGTNDQDWVGGWVRRNTFSWYRLFF